MRSWGRANRLSPATRQGIAVGVATGAYGIGCGALGVAAGLSVPQTMLTSLLLFSGGSQFAFFGVVGAGGSAGTAVAASTLLGLRNAFYSVQMAQVLRLSGWRRLLAAHLTIDESTAVSIGQATPSERRRGFWVTGLAVFVLWNLMTLTGALIGDALGDPRTYGLDAAAAAAFLALLWPRLRGLDPLATAVVAVVLSVAVAPFTPAGVPVLVAVLAALVVGLSPRPSRVPRP
ncbi:MAG TPA: AzlC family ABC transporter permease [Ornithinimicrobium sp.]|uniref:AzlC family ABC transporter permease n=1 Tax=Ornithinimicrobium sp. TaxID=1977084 RepID=UPI002B4A1300|nr:AzlC family ABC transporter permease [Ornithinimicrobium sp.]HKJ12238.1 AzlC family ABC transporter permease [Ornithinimicrobium sp.]